MEFTVDAYHMSQSTNRGQFTSLISSDAEDTTITQALTGRLFDDLSLGALAVRVGLGIGYLPRGLGGRFLDVMELRFGTLRVADHRLYAPYPAARKLSPKVRAEIDNALAARDSRSSVRLTVGERPEDVVRTGPILEDQLHYYHWPCNGPH